MNEPNHNQHSGLSCPDCGSSNLFVVDSRPDSGTVRRRRRCDDCTCRFTTFEVSAFDKRVIDRWQRNFRTTHGIVDKMLRQMNELEKQVLDQAKEDTLVLDTSAADYKRRGDQSDRGVRGDRR